MEIEEIIEALKRKRVKFEIDKKKCASTTQDRKGNITISLCFEKGDSPIKKMIILHETCHAIGYTEEGRRYWITREALIKEELCAVMFSRHMMKELGYETKETRDACDKDSKILLELVDNKLTAWYQAIYHARTAVKKLKEIMK